MSKQKLNSRSRPDTLLLKYGGEDNRSEWWVILNLYLIGKMVDRVPVKVL